MTISLFIGIVVFFCSTLVMAQTGRPQGVGSGNGGIGGDGQTSPFDSIQAPVELDTATINYFYANNPKVIFPENDSLLNNNLQQYDPARKGRFDYLNLGMVGTAATPSVYQPFLRHGLDVGLHAFDIYGIKNSDIKFYHQSKAFSDFYYSAAQQNNNLLNFQFSRSFANGVSLSIDYRRVSSLNLTTFPRVHNGLFGSTSPVSFDPSRGRTAALGVGIWTHRERYDSYLTFTANSTNQLDKGGIDTTLNITGEGTIYAAFAPFLTNATSKNEKYEYAYLQYFKLNRRDSTGLKRAFLASHQISFRNATYRASDPFTTIGQTTKPDSFARRQDSIFYGTFANDLRGIRFYMRERMIENTFNISTSRLRQVLNDTSSKTNKNKIETQQNDWFELGITHTYENVNQEIIKHNFNNVLLKGRWNYTPNPNLTLETYAHFTVLGYNLGDYRVSGNLFLNIKNIGNLTLKAVNQLYAPTYLQDELVVTQRLFWDNNFKKTLETNLSATIAISRLKFEGTVGYSLLNNMIYFDKNAKPQQTATPLSILQFIVNQEITVGKFHLYNNIAVQKTTEKFIRLPEFYMKNSLYWEGKLFKKVMLTRIGLDLRYSSAWFAPNYMPLTGQFFIQETASVAAHPTLDAFLSFRVQRFRFFVKMENLIGDYKNSPYYPIFNNPTPEKNFRFGIKWQLLN